MFRCDGLKLQLLLFSSFFFIVGCNNQISETSQSEEDGTITLVRNHPFDVNKYALNKLVCDPMGGGGQPGAQDGLSATLYYLDGNQPRYNDVQSYIDHGTKSSQSLFFSKLEVPTRLFDQGFPTQTGDLVKDDQGATLFEYFAIRFQSVLKLSENDVPGDYELALLSDDGTVMKIVGEEGSYQVVVDNDGDHPTRMGCGETISMGYETELDVQIDYYQGPRYHISIIPMWRRVDSQTQAEPNCGRKGNKRYFDFNNNSSPQRAYLDMLDRGWQPIAEENWHLPPAAIFNPCQQGQTPVISDLNIQYLGDGVVAATWTTDIPSTSQLLYRNMATGKEQMSQSDNILRTEHSVMLSTGLEFGQSYLIHAVSISTDMGNILSRPIPITIN